MVETAKFTTRSDAAARLVEIWRHFRDSSSPARILDLGCGTGGVALQVASGADIGTAVGLDIAQNNIDQAARNAKESGLSHRLTFVCAPYEAWDGGTFDAIISDSVFHLIEIDDNALASRLAANLAPGGLLIATMPDRSHGNCVRIALRRLWRMCPAAMDRLLLALAKRLYPQFSSKMPWDSPSIAKLRHCVLVWRRRA
jgi:ubiquinone/menaquinone biosynthesis C-methylase UbiE